MMQDQIWREYQRRTDALWENYQHRTDEIWAEHQQKSDAIWKQYRKDVDTIFARTLASMLFVSVVGMLLVVVMLWLAAR